MQNLILAQQSKLTMSSREIAELTGKQVSHIHRDFKTMSIELGFPNDTFNKRLMPSPNVDLGFTYELDDQKRIYSINLNRELTLTLVSGYSIKLRNAIIKRWQELENSKNPMMIASTMNSDQLSLLLSETKSKEAAEQKLIEQAPKVAFVNRFVESKGNKTFREVAKLLKANEREFRAFLYESKVMYQLGGGWTAHANHIDAGRFYVTGGEANGHAYTTCKFTPKGIEYIAGKWIAFKELK